MITATNSRLTVLYSDKRKPQTGERLWLCRCDCGNTLYVDQWRLFHGKAKQCRQCACKEMGKRQRTTKMQHGHAKKRDKPASHTYQIWCGMKQRCYLKGHTHYHRYGGRGITVCERWHDFNLFLEDVGVIPDHLSLDRKDNDGNYEPGNVQLIAKPDQHGNKSTNRLVEWNGVTKTVAAWSRQTGIPKCTIRDRLNRGWSVDDALANRPIH